nr:ATP synthase F0 subunit B [Streptomyces boncukensis]
MPMSASCVVNRAELLAMLDEVRAALPGSLAQAREVLGDRDQVVAQAQQEAQRIIESAQAERGSLVSGTEVARRAQDEADRILAEARREAEEIRAQADDYVDGKLANFEVVLSKTKGSVDRGREKLLGTGPGAESWHEGYDEYGISEPERTSDPHELRQRADAYVDARLGSVSAVLAKTLEGVGKGREKLRGHEPSDELAAHMAAQDGADGYAPPHTSDADYLADLAVPQQQAPQQAPPQQAPQQQPQHHQPQHQQPHQYEPQHQQAVPPPSPQAPPTADPYYAQQSPPVPTQQHDPYGYYYGQQQDPAYYPQQEQQVPQQAYYGQQQPVQQPAQLDETSLFDTSMIDLDQVRAYEQGR